MYRTDFESALSEIYYLLLQEDVPLYTIAHKIRFAFESVEMTEDEQRLFEMLYEVLEAVIDTHEQKIDGICKEKERLANELKRLIRHSLKEHGGLEDQDDHLVIH